MPNKKLERESYLEGADGKRSKWKRGQYRKAAEHEYKSKYANDPDAKTGQVAGKLYESPNKSKTGGKELSRKEVTIRKLQVAAADADWRKRKASVSKTKKKGRLKR